MIVNTRRAGLTMVEMLVVVAIIAILVGILIPAATMVRKTAKNVKQKAQFTAIDLGLAAFKNDYGDYPPSLWWDSTSSTAGARDYCGAQKLAEAMVGWDLLGFHPNSAWRADGLDVSGGAMSYDPARARGDANGDGIVDTLAERRDRYVELEVANAFRLGQSAPGRGDGLFLDGGGAGTQLAENTYVLCDVFEVPGRRVLLSDGSMVSPGTPILYYKANTASKTMVDPTATINATQADQSIYRARDNAVLVNLRCVADGMKPLANREAHPLANWNTFYELIRDPKVQTQPWPYRPDSYILISAGYDGLYGTADDITNFPR
jgi:prepilin-type N-terminal cleavage/methylation domain-containing protein